MTNFNFKYHVASGHIDSMLSLIESGHLELHEQVGYDFSEGPDYYFNTHYVARGGDFLPREVLNLSGNIERYADIGEAIHIRGLPEDAWVMANGGTPVKTQNGNIQFSYKSATNKIELEVAGRYVSRDKITLYWMGLDEIKAHFRDKVDTGAEEARGRVITQGSGQAMTYLRKADAARLLLAGQPISDAQQLRLDDEATRLGVSLEQAAQTLVETADQWEILDATIDNIRLTKKDEIAEAATGAQVVELFNGIDWPV